MKTIVLNFDKSLKCQIGDNGEINILSNHPNKKNAKRLCENIKSIARLEKKGNKATLFLNKVPMVEIYDKSGEVKALNLLTSFETRLFAQGQNIENLPFTRFDKKAAHLRTDLHTHFAGALPPVTLIELAEKQNVVYPEWLVKKLGIDTTNLVPNEKGYLLDDIIANEKNKNILINAMKIDTSEQETFNRMEDIYAARGPITKDPHLFMAQIYAIAKNCQEAGVDYIELSLSSVISDVNQLQLFDKFMPKIEAETGVKVRFLGALWRHSDKEWNEDEIDRLKVTSQSPYVVGMDVMGHETNPTMDFYDEIKEIAKHAMLKDPDFVVRIHAGENPLFKGNVRQVLLAIRQAKEELKKEYNKDFEYPQVRIGHGIYGYHEQAAWDEAEETKDILTEDLFREINPVVEINESSNLSLNNINNRDEVPIKEYIDNGVRVVLGTDGKGIYSTDLDQETILALQEGLSVDDIEKIAKTEKEIISRAEHRFKTHKNCNTSKFFDELKTCYRDGTPHYTKEIEEKYRTEASRLQKELGELIRHSEAETDIEKVEKAIDGKTPIMITGSSHKHWPKISPENQDRIKVVLSVLVQCLDKDKAYLVTGGTNHGVEKEAHIIGNNYNKHNNDELVILGTLTEEATKTETNSIEKDTITHAIISTINGRPAKRWFDLPDAVLLDIQKREGMVVAIGGGPIVSDIIQRGHNIGIKMAMMSEVEGASGDKSKSLTGNGYEFANPKELIQKIQEACPGAIRADITSEKLDHIVMLAEKTIKELKELDAVQDTKQKEQKVEALNKEIQKIVEDDTENND